MFIKAIKKRNAGSPTTYVYHRLMESYRTSRGPRQRTVLNLGTLELPKSQWRDLARRIEQILAGQAPLQPPRQEAVEELAQHYAPLVRSRESRRAEWQAQQSQPEYRSVDLRSVEQHRPRSIGAEYVGLSYLRKLGMRRVFREVGLDEGQVVIAELLVVARMVHPSSELGTLGWSRHLSGIGELLGPRVKKLSGSALYRVSDRLYEHKEEIEGELRRRERGLFGLEEKVILYDLTNTFFEGEAYDCEELKHGKSKDKRSECPLMTVGLVIDEWGFAKRSEFFSGSVNEAQTLGEMLVELGAAAGATVVVDAGIATEENLLFLRSEGYHYVCVSRSKPIEEESELQGEEVEIKAEKNKRITGRLLKGEQEWLLVCHSEKREAKEQAMAAGFRRRFEEGLEAIRASLHTKGGTKRYEKVIERIGRLKERTHGIHRYYDIRLEKQEDVATALEFSYHKPEEARRRYGGRYCIRTNRTDLDEKQLWQLYITLGGVEDSFRSLKSELGLRPVYHRAERRIKGHLFITLLAYHVANAVRHRLRAEGFRMSWSTLRDRLATHMVSTISMKAEDGKRIHLRSTSTPEVFHRDIYRALDLGVGPLRRRRTEL